jgi:hypothetical protein
LTITLWAALHRPRECVGKSYIDLTDRNISGAGKAGIWSKADSVTSFDDFQLKAGN